MPARQHCDFIVCLQSSEYIAPPMNPRMSSSEIRRVACRPRSEAGPARNVGPAAQCWNSARGWLALVSVAVALVLGAGGCTRKIGDSCKANLDCSVTNTGAFCDLASPQGYCTVEGCDATSCPDDGVCVRFFTLPRSGPQCNPQTRPCCDPATADCRQPCACGERCLCDDESCSRAYCASETSERRWCMHRCTQDSDCREGYQCRTTGQGGAESVTVRDESGDATTPTEKFCAPVAQ